MRRNVTLIFNLVTRTETLQERLQRVSLLLQHLAKREIYLDTKLDLL